MIYRMIFRAQLLAGSEQEGINSLKNTTDKLKSLVDAGSLMTFCAYKWERNIFLYYECIDKEIYPDELFEDTKIFLENWPGEEEKRQWIPMVDVFHFNHPVDKEHWRRKSTVERRIGKVSHLKPEMIPSYIYYHYQLQEERALIGDKYQIIAIHENLMFGYFEAPAVVEDPVLQKKLQTSGTPKNWEDSRMDLHFDPWPDGWLFFKEIEQLFEVY